MAVKQEKGHGLFFENYLSNTSQCNNFFRWIGSLQNMYCYMYTIQIRKLWSSYYNCNITILQYHYKCIWQFYYNYNTTSKMLSEKSSNKFFNQRSKRSLLQVSKSSLTDESLHQGSKGSLIQWSKRSLSQGSKRSLGQWSQNSKNVNDRYLLTL